MAKIPRVLPGPANVDAQNRLIDEVNRATDDGNPIGGGRPFGNEDDKRLVLFELTEDVTNPTSSSSGANEDLTANAQAKQVWFRPGPLTYEPYDDDKGPRFETLYFPISLAPSYSEGDRFWAYRNPESLRWEVLYGEVAGNCGSFLNLHASQIPGYDGGARQVLSHDSSGCLEWLDTTECSPDSSSSSSSGP